MGVKPENTPPWQFVPACGEQAGCQLIQVTCRTQWIRRRFAATNLLADGFFEIDDRALLIHEKQLPCLAGGGERSFVHSQCTSSFAPSSPQRLAAQGARGTVMELWNSTTFHKKGHKKGHINKVRQLSQKLLTVPAFKIG